VADLIGPGVRRLVAVIDAEAYSLRSHPEQFGLQHRLDAVVRAGLAAAGVRRRRVEVQDRGDGQLLVLPAGIDEARALPGLLRGLLGALGEDASRWDSQPRLRMRAALSQGVVHLGATGYVGRAVVEACRMVDSDEVRDELRAVANADLCLVVGDDLYRDVVAQGYGGVPGDGFRRIVVPSKGTDLQAWVRALSDAALGPDPAAVGAVTAAGVLPLGTAAYFVHNAARETADDNSADDLDGDLFDPDVVYDLDDEAAPDDDDDQDDLP
jgi:hypothetical protein